MTTCNHPAASAPSETLVLCCTDCGAECSESQIGDDGLCYDEACPLHVMAGTLPVTDDQISTLRDEAGAHGDLAQVEVCTSALAGDETARRECARVIAAAEAQAAE